MIVQRIGNKQQNNKFEGEKTMTQEIQETLAKIKEYEELIENAENALDAAIENLEEALEEANEEQDQ